MHKSYSEKYKKEFENYLIEFLPTINRKPTQANQMAIDVFYLERNYPQRDFMYWFQSDDTFNEAKEVLDMLFKNRKSYKKSLKDHIDYMSWFKQFLNDNERFEYKTSKNFDDNKKKQSLSDSQIKCQHNEIGYYKIIKRYFYEILPDDVDINEYFNPKRKKDMKEIFYQFCLNMQDYNMMPSVIGFMREDRKIQFSKIFLNYDLKAVVITYTEETLFKKFCNEFEVKNKESKNNLWTRYARSIMDSCVFLSRFANAKDFNDYIESFNGNLDIIYDISSHIRGMGFALACNIIKDLGFVNYAKPDTHTKDVIEAMGYLNDDVSVIRAIQNIANENNDTAFNVDRMIWLICSGYFYNENIRVGSHKKDLIQRIHDYR